MRMAMGEFKWMEERVDELITLFEEERPYACLYNMKSREYRNRKIFALDDIATALAIIVARSLVQLYIERFQQSLTYI